MSFHLKRPQREDQEEDLLRFQEEFLKSKGLDQPAAKVVKVQSNNQNAKESVKNEQKIDIDDDESDMLVSVLTEIKENPLITDHNDIRVSLRATSTIPKVEKINIKELSEQLTQEKRKNKSLFAQNLERQGKLKSHFQLNNIHQLNNIKENEKIKIVEKQVLGNKMIDSTCQVSSSKPFERKQIITGDGLGSQKDAEKIHLENLELLANMKQEDILKEQEKLMQQLDPKIVSFLRGRKTSKDAQNHLSEMKETNLTSNLTKEEILKELPIKIDKKWVNMDKIEYEKLEWMIKPKVTLKTNESSSSSARFDFEGNLIAPNEDVPVTKALYHHGNEPDRAGYTLDELFHLARSKFNQQRVLALKTLSNILRKCHLGYYSDKIKADATNLNQEEDVDEPTENDKNNLLNQLIQGGVLFLLRCNLDDQTESIINVSLNAIKELLQPSDQEYYFDFTFDLFKGHEMVSLHPFSLCFNDESHQQRFKVDKDLNLTERKELNEMKDDEFIQHDLIRGLFRMNLMERIFYLLDKYKPTLATNQIINDVFMILFRCMRHSPDLTNEFTQKHYSLIDLIVKNYLPLFMSPNLKETNVIFAIENATSSLKFLRLIASAGPTIALKLWKKHNLGQILANYLSSNYLNDEASNKLKNEIIKLQTEAIRSFKVFGIFNSEEITTSLIDVFEIILKNLTSLINQLKINNSLDSDIYESNLLLLQAYISLYDTMLSSLSDTDSHLKHDMFSTIYKIVSTFAIDHFQEFFNGKSSDQKYKTVFETNLISCCLNFIVNYLEKQEICSASNKAETLDRKLSSIEKLVENVLKPILNNDTNLIKFDQLVMSKLLASSTSSSETSYRQSFDSIRHNNLTYLPTMLNMPSDALRHGPFAFLSSFMTLYLLCFKLRFKMIDGESGNFLVTKKFLKNSYLRSYLKAFCKNNSQAKDSLNGSYLILRYESLFVYNYLKLVFTIFNFEDNDSENIKKSSINDHEEKHDLYLLALNLLTKFKSGDEYFIYDIISTFLFNINIWSSYLLNPSATDKNFLIKHFEQISLNDTSVESQQLEFSYLNINFGKSETIKITKNFLSNMESVHIYENLNQIKFNYLDNDYLLSSQLTRHSTKLNSVCAKASNYGVRTSENMILKNLFLTSNFYTNKFLLSSDWFYMPIINEMKVYEKMQKQTTSYKVSDENASQKAKDNASLRVINSITNTLKYIYLLESYFGDYLELNVNYTLRYVRLLYVYLFDSEVFLDKQLITYLYLLFFKYATDSRKPFENLNLNQKIDDIISFYDFYQYLLTHYDSTSFGDYLFSLYLIIPLQQKYPPKYRQLFWSDFSHLFKFARFNNEFSKLIIPLSNFLTPNEKSLHLIRLYSQVLLDPVDFQMISHSKLAYTIIVAHLNSFIFEHVHSDEKRVEFDFKKLLLSKILALNNQKLRDDLINFKCIRKGHESIELYEDLPDIRKQWFKKLIS